MAIALVLSLSATITLAAFAANKSGSLTLTFADGLTMRLDPLGNSGRIQFQSADENTATFNYVPVTNLTGAQYWDGINATINKDAFVAIKLTFIETTSGQDVAPSGAFVVAGNGLYCQFRPPGSYTWYAEMAKDGVEGFTFSLTSEPNTFISTSVKLTASNSPIKLFDRIAVRGTTFSYVTDLGGRSFKFLLTVKARTDAVPTF